MCGNPMCGPECIHTLVPSLKEQADAYNAIHAKPEPSQGSVLSEQVAAAFRMIHSLCAPKYAPEHRDWVMSIPADPERDPDLVISSALRALQSEISTLRKQLADREWISVQERLPRHCQIVWISAPAQPGKTAEMVAGYFEDVGFRSDGFSVRPTHWVPLLSPPQLAAQSK